MLSHPRPRAPTQPPKAFEGPQLCFAMVLWVYYVVDISLLKVTLLDYWDWCTLGEHILIKKG